MRDIKSSLETETRVLRNEGEYRPWWDVGWWFKGGGTKFWKGFHNLSSWCMQKHADVMKNCGKCSFYEMICSKKIGGGSIISIVIICGKQ